MKVPPPVKDLFGGVGLADIRDIDAKDPAELVMLDSNEAGLHAVQLSLDGKADLDSEDLVLGDIRDVDTLRRLFDERRPEVVFHAAALKHVWGTLAVLEAPGAGGVERFVNVSTDKAADPLSVLGYSRRITERLTAHFGLQTGRPFLLTV